MKFNIRLLAGLLLMLSTITTAQGNPNSAEFHARHNTNSPYYNDGAQQYAVPQPVWADRWGAIASDGNGTYGFVTDMRSKRRAEKAAIEDCKKDGGGACSLRLAFFNQCAVVMAGIKAAATASAATKEEAVELGKKTCRENGDNACSVYWSGCSTAVRVN